MKSFSKKLIGSFSVVVFVGVALFAAMNFLVDPFYFFRWSSGLTQKEAVNMNRRVRCASILQNSDSDTFQGIIVGGSKSKPISEEWLQRYTGMNWLSCSVGYGDFEYYEEIIRYALQQQQLKRIILHLSGIEIYQDPPLEDIETYRIPEFIITGNKTKDILFYLFSDPTNSIDALLEGRAPSLQTRFSAEKANELEVSTYKAYSEDNHEIIPFVGVEGPKSEDAANMDIVMGRIYAIRRSGYKSYYTEAARGTGAKEDWARTNVLEWFGPYDWCLEQLFTGEKDLKNKESNILHLRNIVNLCQAYDVELTVVLGSTFLTERMWYEGQEYWDYLYQISLLTDFYDFSYFCEINNNPYNFFNANHNLDFVSCVMIDNLYGKGAIPFGCKVTSENFSEYIAQRQTDYFALEREFRETGAVQLPGLGSESDLSTLSGEFLLEMARQ